MKLSFYTYNLPFVCPFKTAKEALKSRRGIFLHLQKDGLKAWGEAAPLPGFSEESLQQVAKQLYQLRPSIYDFFASDFSIQGLHHFCENHNMWPSLNFGLLTLGSFFLAQKENKSLHRFLCPSAVNGIPLNTVIGLGHNNLQKTVQKRIKNGFKTIKLKANNDASFLSRLEVIRNHHPHIKIRLDANQSWSFQQAVQFLERAEPFDIEYCEEPLAHPDEESLIKLGRKTSIPLALDESLATSFSLKQASKIVPVLIIKPMVLGDCEMIQKLKIISKDEDTKLVFTSSLESSIGRFMTASLAAGLGAKETAHGLSTGKLLSDDAWDDARFIQNGLFRLPNAEGLRSLVSTDLHKLNLEKIVF